MNHSSAFLTTPPYFACFRSFSRTEATAGDWNLTFNNPDQLLSGTIGESKRLVEFADTASRQGYWVVMAIKYEAAPAFDADFHVHIPAKGQTVAWAATFKPEEVVNLPPLSPERKKYHIEEWVPAVKRSEYNRAIAEIKSWIKAGYTYQVNYTFPLYSRFSGDVESWFHDLGTAQQAEYCALLNLPEQLVLSLSPELFFLRKGNILKTRPMKGTIARGRFPAEDYKRMIELSQCPKNRAENVMITDLVRNDLGRIAKPGTVTVPHLFKIEKFKTVWQMTSEIQAHISSETNLADIFTALFPCGSITGAPKIRTMRIIKDLEPFPRGIYTGAIGFLKPGGNGIFNIPIRTVNIDKKTGESQFGVGGGITADSTSSGEFDECRLKASFLSTPPVEFSLLETMLLEEGTWFLLDYHLQRFRQSAEYFQLPYNRMKILHQLRRLQTEHPRQSWKTRLLIDPDGEIQTEINHLPTNENNHTLSLKLSRSAVDAKNVFLFHKTTHRSIYTQARQDQPDCDEVILHNEKGELTEGCIHNLVIEKNNLKWTPPVECGLLPGTFRRQLLETGKIKEKILRARDLQQADQVWLINSVRKWRKAKLLE